MKKMNRINVFNNPYNRWSRPSCWGKNLRLFFSSFRWAYERITRGFASCDVCDLDNYYLDIFAGTLNALADDHESYMCSEEFPDDESWTKYLREMAQKFYNANSPNRVYSKLEVVDADKMMANDLHEGLKMLDHVFFGLWS